MNNDPSQGQVVPTQGTMSSAEHTAFMLRVLMYLVAKEDQQILEVDLNDVLAATKDKEMEVAIDREYFALRLIDRPVETKSKLIMPSTQKGLI